jgi:Raf kinase inhibitor-like YbhB/YbcL family protein
MTARSGPPAREVAILTMRCAAFDEGGTIPVEHTCDGVDLSPTLSWTGAPPGTEAFALIVHDPDAPAGDWVHWLLYDIPRTRRQLPPAVPARPEIPGLGKQGMNDFHRLGWGGPCPPRGTTHHYRFRLLALDAALVLPPRLTLAALLAATRGHVLAEAELTGSYRRQ